MRVAAWVLAATVLLAACGDGSDPRIAGGTTPSDVNGTTTTIPAAPHLFPTTTQATGVQLLPSTEVNRTTKVQRWSWTGQRFDIGVIGEIQPLDGAWIVSFVRQSIRDGHGTRSAAQLTTEPVIVGNDPTQVIDTRQPPRLFGVRSTATVTRLSPAWNCGQPAAWVTSSMDELSTNGVGSEQIDTLTFDGQGQVTAIRLSRRC